MASAWVWLPVMVLLGAAFRATLSWLVLSWLGNPAYSHGLLVPLVSVALAWRSERRNRAGSAPGSELPASAIASAPSPRSQERPPACAAHVDVCHRESGGECCSSMVKALRFALSDRLPSVLRWSSVGSGLVVVAVVLALNVHVLARANYLLSALCLPVALGGCVLARSGPRALWRQVFPLAYLFLAVPLPWVTDAAPTLARTIANAAASLAHGMGLAVVAHGAQLEMPGTAVVVGAPCSGMNSLVALVALAAVYGRLARGPWWGRLALVLLAVPLAILANLLRLVLLLLVASLGGAQLALSSYHLWASPALFLIAVGLLLAIGKGLRCSVSPSAI